MFRWILRLLLKKYLRISIHAKPISWPNFKAKEIEVSLTIWFDDDVVAESKSSFIVMDE